jgi:hypothetical protein
VMVRSDVEACGPLFPLPPQPLTAVTMAIRRSARRLPAQRRGRLSVRKKKPRTANTGALADHGAVRNSADLAAVWMVSTDVAPAAPGVTVDGAKIAVAPVGSPTTVKLTAVVNAPPCGVVATL